MIKKYFISLFILLFNCTQDSIDNNKKSNGDLLNNKVLNIAPNGSEKYLNYNSDFITIRIFSSASVNFQKFTPSSPWTVNEKIFYNELHFGFLF